MRAGDIALAPHGAEHGFSPIPRALGELPAWVPDPRPHDPGPADFDFLCGAYRLDRGQVHLYLRRLPGVIAVSPDYGGYPALRSLIDLLDDDVTGRQTGTEVTRPALVDLLLVHTLRLWQQEQGTTGRLTVQDATIAAALQEIHDSPQTLWTVGQLSELAGMSRTVFTRRFTASVGKPPMAYLISWRLIRSAQLLRETKAPLAAIARQVGYSSEFAFASAFRREFGISPGRFRNSRMQPGNGPA